MRIQHIRPSLTRMELIDTRNLYIDNHLTHPTAAQGAIDVGPSILFWDVRGKDAIVLSPRAYKAITTMLLIALNP